MTEDRSAATAITNLPCLRNDKWGQMIKMQNFPNEHCLKPESRWALTQPQVLMKLHLFPPMCIWHSSKPISAFVFTAASMPVLSHNNSLGINKRAILLDNLEIFTWQHNMILCTVCAAGSLLCLAGKVQMQDFITCFFSWVSNDTGLFYRCSLDKIWITQAVLQRSLQHNKSTLLNPYKEKIWECWTGNSCSLGQVWSTHKTLKTMPSCHMS